jgi:hypothetical protein
MADVKAYWDAVKRAASQLTDEEYYIMSLDEPALCSVGGVICQAPRQVAARLIVGKTHRLATTEETAAHLGAEKIKAVEYAERERARLLASNPFAALAEASAKPKK